jgi:hypothetical protein
LQDEKTATQNRQGYFVHVPNAGMPLLVRKTRPYGLTRGLVLKLEHGVNF